MNANNLVSVIIPNYNYEKFIAETIESVLSQTYKNVEIIVVDDGSKDKSLEVLEKFGDKIRVIQQKNAGVSAARNHGVSFSKGEFIAFLDADDAYRPEFLETVLNLNKNFPHLPFYTHISEDDVILEKKSESTYGNAVQSLALVKALKCRNILLITSQWHMFRSQRIFRQVYPSSIGIMKMTVSNKEDFIVSSNLSKTLKSF